MKRWRVHALILVVSVVGPVNGQQTAPYMPHPLPGTVITSPRASQSAAFDKEAADTERQRQEGAYIERIFVEGRDPDVRRGTRKPLERRFANSLLAPPPSPMAGIRMLDTTPCMSLASTWNNIGSSFVPLSGCPR